MREIVETRQELTAARADYERMGWEIVENGDRRIVAERGLRSSWVWHLLYFWFAPIYANAIYSAYRRYDRPERRVVRLTGESEGSPAPSNGTARERGDREESPKQAVRRVEE